MPGKIKSSKNKTFVPVVIILILLIDLVFLFYVKYENQGLPFSNFNIYYFGNILNLIFTLLAVAGVIVYTLKKKNDFNSFFLLAFTILLSISLALAAISTKVNLPLPNVYFLDHPLQKIAEGALFSFYQYMQFMFIAILWFDLLGGKELVILRAVFNSAAFVMLLLAVSFVYINLKKINNKSLQPEKNSLNVAVVLGAAVWSHNAPSPSLAARAEKAVELYKKGIVNRIQLTGSNAPGELSEAEVAFNYIKLDSINPKNIWMEKKTVSTAEQIRFIKDSLASKKNIGRIIIVSDSYHLTRVREMCSFYKLKAGLAASDLNLSFQHNLYYKFKESIALLVFWFFAL